MISIDNVNVYGLEEAIAASGLPMQDGFSAEGFTSARNEVLDAIADEDESSRHLKRAVRLSAFAPGEGHHCYLCGVNVQANVTAPLYWWPQLQRYHFIDPVSSTSTMHRLVPFVLKCMKAEKTGDRLPLWDMFTPETPSAVVVAFYEEAKKILGDGEGDDGNVKLALVRAALPGGWLQTMRITTNYRALKTVYHQRKGHALQEWRDFCKWVEGLPASELITGGEQE